MKKCIHLIAPAGGCKSFLSAVNLPEPETLIAIIRDCLPHYEITFDLSLMFPDEDDLRGGRRDDLERARDIQTALANPEVAAIIALRGGAWFTRILPRIDFSLLETRETPVHFFGFSELTTIANILAAHENARAYYAMGPAFLTYGLKRYAAARAANLDPEFVSISPAEWMLANWGHYFAGYFQQVAAIIEGRQSLAIQARLISGSVSARSTIRIVGGNLTVLSTMIGSCYETAIDPRGRWLALEDFNDKPERFDRFLAHLTLAGFWEKCVGLLLGDFHNAEIDLVPAILEMLKFHMPDSCKCPILVTPDVGHTWPMIPLPLNQPGQLQCQNPGTYSITWPATKSQSARSV